MANIAPNDLKVIGEEGYRRTVQYMEEEITRLHRNLEYAQDIGSVRQIQGEVLSCRRFIAFLKSVFEPWEEE